MKNGQALPDHIVNAGTHTQIGRIVSNFFDFFDLGLELLARKLKQVVGLRQAIMGMRILCYIQTDNALEEAARNHNVIVHKQANLGGRNLDHNARLTKAVQINAHAVLAAFGHLHAKFAQVVPCAAHVTQISGHMKFH